MKPLRDLFAQFKAYHEHDRPFVQYTGTVGIFAFPIFYLLRFTKVEAPYNDLWLRALASLVCLGLALKNHWPEKARPYFMAYAYGALLFCLPFFFIFTSLANGGGVVAVANTLMAVFFLILLSDWRNTIVMLTIGMTVATALFYLVVPHAELPMDYVARLPIAVLVVVGGSLFKFAEKQAEADKLKRTYTALAGSIAHEMRNPLSQVRLALDSIERTLPAPTTSDDLQQVPAARLDELYRHLSAGQLAVQRGLQVISLTLGEVRSASVNPASFSFISAAAVTRRAVDEYSYESAEHRARVQVRVHEDFTFRGDETVYLFILFNLIRNALYYFDTHPKSRLTVTVDAQRIVVRDTGPGIPDTVLAHLFEAFNSSGKSDGTGLGLSYCRRAMRAFGGDIECQSQRGQFTEFTLRFPVVPPEDVEIAQEQRLTEASASLSGARVLVVDDEPRLRQSASRMLGALGCVTVEAAGGQQAIDLLHGIECDVMVLDLKMPGVDGYAVAMRVRSGEIPGYEHLPIVALTSEPAHIAFPKARKVGMNGFVNKPGTPLALATALRSALQPLPQGARPLEGRTVVLAEDNAYSRSVMRANLQQWGLQVVEAWSGEAVIGHLEADRQGGPAIDLVLMDLNMPGMDGLQATEAIRARGGEWARLPIVALTGHSEEEMIGRAMEAGVTDYLVKPIEAGALLQQLLRYLGAPPTSSQPPLSAPLVPPEALRAMAEEPRAAARKGKEREADAASTRSPGARPPSPPVDPALQAEDRAALLLDTSRLAQLERIDMLDSLPLYLEQMHLLLDRLAAARAADDLAAGRDALHSLLGISGDAGASALHAASRALYPELSERRWPIDPGWLTRLNELARATESLMRERYVKSPAD